MNRKAVIRGGINIPIVLNDLIFKYDYYIAGIIDSEINTFEDVYTFKVLKDGRIFIYSLDGNSFTLLDRDVRYTMENRIGPISKMVILPDDRIAVLSDSDNIAIINPNTRKYDVIFREHHDGIINGQLYFINQIGDKYDILSIDFRYIKIWDSNNGKIKNNINTKGIEYNFLSQISINEIIVSHKGYIESCDLRTNKIKFRISTEKEKVIYGKLLPDRKIWTVSKNFSVDIYDLVTGKVENLHNFKLDIFIHHYNDKYILIEDEYGLNLFFWNIRTLLNEYVYSNKNSFVNSSVLLPDERMAVTLHDKIFIFDLSSHKNDPFIITLFSFRRTIIDLLPNGRIILSSYNLSSENHFLATLK